MAMSLGELQLRMCPMVLKCYRCSFYIESVCRIADGAYRQRSCQHTNNPSNIKRQWSLCNEVEVKL